MFFSSFFVILFLVGAYRCRGGGYFYENIGSVTSEPIEYYTTQQQGKHWMLQDQEVVQEKRGQLSLRGL